MRFRIARAAKTRWELVLCSCRSDLSGGRRTRTLLHVITTKRSVARPPFTGYRRKSVVVREKNRKGRPRQHALRCPSQNEIPNPRVSERSHDKEIRVARSSVQPRTSPMSRPAASTVSRVTLSPWAPRCLETAAATAWHPEPLVGNGYNADVFSLFEDGKRIGEGPCGSPTEVPGHNHGIQCELTGLFARVRDYKGRTAGANMIASAYRSSPYPPSGTGTIVRSRRRAYPDRRPGTSSVSPCSRILSWKMPRLSAAARNSRRRLSALVSSSLPPPPPWLADRARDRPESCLGLETRSRKRWRKCGLR